MVQMIVMETNKYATQKGSAFRTTLAALEWYIRVLLRMGIVHMPRYRMYWSTELHYNPIADFMSQKLLLCNGLVISSLVANWNMHWRMFVLWQVKLNLNSLNTLLKVFYINFCPGQN